MSQAGCTFHIMTATKHPIAIPNVGSEMSETVETWKATNTNKATTAGRTPRRTDATAVESLNMLSEMYRLTIKSVDGTKSPRVARAAPGRPAILYPTRVDTLVAIGPGKALPRARASVIDLHEWDHRRAATPAE
jgi:hypothetical protein